MKAVIVDDEPLAREILRDYISETPELELVAEFDSAIKASVWFQHNSAEILFLDIAREHPPDLWHQVCCQRSNMCILTHVPRFLCPRASLPARYPL